MLHIPKKHYHSFVFYLRDSYICDQFTAIHPWVIAFSYLVFHGGWLSVHLLLCSAPLPLIIEADTVSPMAVILHCFNHPTSPIFFLKFFTSVYLIIPESLYPGQTKNKRARWTMYLVDSLEFLFSPNRCNEHSLFKMSIAILLLLFELRLPTF